MGLNLRGDELRAAFARLRGCLAEGLDDDAIGERFGLGWQDIEELKRRFLDQEAETLRTRSTEHTYAIYVTEQRQCLGDLDDLINEYRGGEEDGDSKKDSKKNASAVIGAVRARSDIIDRIMKMGQEVGLIERKSDGKSLAAGAAITQMTNVQIRQYIITEMGHFNDLMARFGDKSIEVMDPGPLHRSLPVPKEKVKGHARSSVFKGRRAVRGGKGAN